jgi:hypothetical protein
MINDDPYSALVKADGTAVITFTTQSSRNVYTVQQVTVENSAAPVGATCEIRKNGSLITPMIPTGDAAGGDPPILLRQSDRLTVEFAGCTPGTTCSVFIIYDDGSKA